MPTIMVNISSRIQIGKRKQHPSILYIEESMSWLMIKT